MTKIIFQCTKVLKRIEIRNETTSLAISQVNSKGSAIQMDVDDVRSKFGNKYDKAIKEMIDYSKTLNLNNFKEKRIEK